MRKNGTIRCFTSDCLLLNDVLLAYVVTVSLIWRPIHFRAAIAEIKILVSYPNFYDIHTYLESIHLKRMLINIRYRLCV